MNVKFYIQMIVLKMQNLEMVKFMVKVLESFMMVVSFNKSILMEILLEKFIIKTNHYHIKDNFKEIHLMVLEYRRQIVILLKEHIIME